MGRSPWGGGRSGRFPGPDDAAPSAPSARFSPQRMVQTSWRTSSRHEGIPPSAAIGLVRRPSASNEKSFAWCGAASAPESSGPPDVPDARTRAQPGSRRFRKSVRIHCPRPAPGLKWLDTGGSPSLYGGLLFFAGAVHERALTLAARLGLPAVGRRFSRSTAFRWIGRELSGLIRCAE